MEIKTQNTEIYYRTGDEWKLLDLEKLGFESNRKWKLSFDCNHTLVHGYPLDKLVRALEQINAM